MAAESEDSEIPVEFDVNVSNEGDLGIGDHSAALSFEAVDDVHRADHDRADVVFAQVGNDLVGVAHTVTGDPQSGFDPRAELQTDRRLARTADPRTACGSTLERRHH